MKSLGIILIVIGILMMVIRGFVVPVEKNVVDVGPVKINKTENKWIGWPTYAGAVLVIVGVIVTLSGRKSVSA
ncbi:MAG TPA: hypothetical protein VK772_17675 [Puia sp.]|nr:hypothetical protein [Puia sp.]